MSLFIKMFKTQFKRLKKEDIRVLFSGRKEGLPSDVVESMELIENDTKDNEYIFNICLNYGGQTEIIDTVKKIINDKVDINLITTESFKHYLYNNLPDVDLLIRTGGEKRISNFMLYLLAYSELYFTDTYFPDFNEIEFDKAIEYFNTRERRFGGNNDKRTNE
jgi:undecaprenyl diphosphate synthase